MLDVESVIQRAKRAEEEINPRTGEERWNIHGPGAENQPLVVTVEFEESTLHIVTIKPDRKGRK